MTLAARPGDFRSELRRTWELATALAIRSLRVRYRATLLGQVWWVVRPLAMGFILWFALGRVLRVGVEHYPLFLMTGLYPWFWFESTVSGSADVLVSNGGLIRKAVFPRFVLPLTSVLTGVIQFMYTLPVILLFAAVSGETPGLTWLVALPVLLIVQISLLMGLAPLVASLNVFFRDVGPMVEVAMRLLFYGTPIIYPLSRVPHAFRPLVLLNPMTSVIEGWRDMVMTNTFAGADLWPAIVITAVALVLGLGVFRMTEKHFADAL
jgi:lipopolysaccharide transport system permease protein